MIENIMDFVENIQAKNIDNESALYAHMEIIVRERLDDILRDE